MKILSAMAIIFSLICLSACSVTAKKIDLEPTPYSHLVDESEAIRAIEVIDRSIQEQQSEKLRATSVVIDLYHFRAEKAEYQSCVEFSDISQQRVTQRGSTYRVELLNRNGHRIYLLNDQREQFVKEFVDAVATIILFQKNLIKNNGARVDCSVTIIEWDPEKEESCEFVGSAECSSSSYKGRSKCKSWHSQKATTFGANVVSITSLDSKYRWLSITGMSTTSGAKYYFCPTKPENPLVQEGAVDQLGKDTDWSVYSAKTAYKNGEISRAEYDDIVGRLKIEYRASIRTAKNQFSAGQISEETYKGKVREAKIVFKKGAPSEPETAMYDNDATEASTAGNQGQDIEEKLRLLRNLFKDGLITEQQYKAKREEVLASI